MIGGWELIVILLVALLLFGGKKLPELAKNLGKGMREFRKASSGIEEAEEEKCSPIKKECTSCDTCEKKK